MPRNVVFVAPFPIETTMRFVRAAAKLDDVRLLGRRATRRREGDDARALRTTSSASRSRSIVQDTLDGVEVLRRRHGAAASVIGILEPLMVQLAEARAQFGVAGHAARGRRSLPRQGADEGRAARGGPAGRAAPARHLGADARAFAEEVGFPMVLKPPAGMGAKATFRVSTLEALLRAVVGMGA